MTRVVIVGEMYNADLSIGGGPVYPGGQPSHPWVPPSPGYPAHPIAPGSPGSPSHPIYNPAYPDQGLPGVPPGFWGGVAPPYPSQGLPGGQPYPDQGLPGSQPYPDQGLPGGGQSSGTPVPEDVYTPAPIPEEIASQYVVSVYNPKTMGWTTKSYPPR